MALTTDTHDEELRLYAVLAPRMAVECPAIGEKAPWHGVDWPKDYMHRCTACEGTGKVTPLVDPCNQGACTSRHIVYAYLGRERIVPLGLLLETAAKMGLHYEMGAGSQCWATCWFKRPDMLRGVEYSKGGPTSTLAVLRALTAALDARA